jgi:hypothetical protein
VSVEGNKTKRTTRRRESLAWLCVGERATSEVGNGVRSMPDVRVRHSVTKTTVDLSLTLIQMTTAVSCLTPADACFLLSLENKTTSIYQHCVKQ